MKNVDILYVTRLTPAPIRALRRSVNGLSVALGILIFVVIHQGERLTYLENKG